MEFWGLFGLLLLDVVSGGLIKGDPFIPLFSATTYQKFTQGETLEQTSLC